VFRLAARNRLTTLLKEHILGAVRLVQGAKSADKAEIGNASSAWYANGNQVAGFLSSANPHNWPRARMRAMMRAHLDQTLSEATNRLGGNYAADVRDYEAIHRHILRDGGPAEQRHREAVPEPLPLKPPPAQLT
jgi:hypothetical protein